jgi:photosystem II stability/assembly factor-like uncharacterized protein
LEIESGNSNVVYAASLNGGRGVLLRSQDGGKSWEEKYISTEGGKQLNRVQIDPQQKNIVYIGTEQGGFIKSLDRGESWQNVKWFSTGVKDFVIDYTNTKGVIILTHHGLFKAVDGGTESDKSWAILTSKVLRTMALDSENVNGITSVTIDNQNPLVLYLTYSNLIYVSHDGGLNWSKLPTITPARKASQRFPSIRKVGLVGGTIYYGAGNALYKSTDKGNTWTSFDMPVLSDVKYTVSDPKEPDVIYVGTAGNQ